MFALEECARLRDPVGALLRRVARECVMPRFRHLRHGEVTEKTPGEVVTIADREAEVQLARGLAQIVPDARVIGEEACSADPSLMEALDDGLAWIVDPIDGTANFAAGHGPFGLMIALVDRGDAIAGWIHDPLADRLYHGVRGQGATCDGRPLTVSRGTGARPVASLATQFMPPAERERVEGQAHAAFDLAPIPRCAAEHYPRVIRGENDVALFQRTLPWDHAAGTLILTEAGGVATDWDGAPYRAGRAGHGLLVANSREAWDMARRTIFAGTPPPPYPG